MALFCTFISVFEVIVQIRVGGLPPISKHREELKLRGEAEHFKRTSCYEIGGSPTCEYLSVLLKLSRYISRENLGEIWRNFVISSSDFRTSSTLLIFFDLGS